MRRLVRWVVRVGLAAGALWLVRAGLKSWIDGPEVTRRSGGWPDSPGRPGGEASGRDEAPGSTRATAPSASQAAVVSVAQATVASTAQPTVASGPVEDSQSQPAKKSAKASAKKASSTSKRRSESSAPGSWVAPNGSADLLVTHPVKAKLASRVYRVPGMPMYDRTVADRCYATVEAAEADGFNRAAR